MSLHVLIIDDDPLTEDILGRLIRQQGATFTLLTDPMELEAALGSFESVDVVFVDLEMPMLSGYEVLPILQQRLPETTPIVACTVHTSEVGVALGLGFQAFIGKPIDPVKFPDAWQRILSGERFRMVQ